MADDDKTGGLDTTDQSATTAPTVPRLDAEGKPVPSLLDVGKQVSGALVPGVGQSQRLEDAGKSILGLFNDKTVPATDEEAAARVGNTTPLTGPNAGEARNFLTNTRINAGWPKDKELPPYITGMAKARALGHTWDDINEHLANWRTEAEKRGYTSDQIATTLYGAPIETDHKPISFDHVPSPAEAGADFRNLADRIQKWGNDPIRDVFEGMKLPVPGQTNSAGDILARQGWDVINFAKSFGAAPLNGLAAIAETFDGKPRTAYEWEQLGYESAGFLMLFAAGKEGKAGDLKPLPKVGDVVDAASGIEAKHGTPLPEAQRAVGEGFVNKPEGPFIDPDKLRQIQEERFDIMDDPRPIEERVKEGEGAKHPDPVKAMAADMAAVDKIVDTSDTSPIPKVREMTFEDLMGVKKGDVPPEPLVNITPETLFRKDPEVASGVYNDLKRLFTPGSLAPAEGEAIAAQVAQTAAEKERSVGQIIRFGRAIGELASTARVKLIDDIEVRNLDEYKGTPLGRFATEMRKQLDYWHGEITRLGGEVGYVTDYIKHMYANPEAAAKFFLEGRNPLAGSKGFTKERIFGTYADARAAGLKMATDNPLHLTTIAIHQMARYVTALRIVKDFRENNYLIDVANKTAAPKDYTPISGKLGATDGGTLYAPKDVAGYINSLTDPGLSKYPLYRLLRSASNLQIQLQLSISGFHGMFILNDVMTSGVSLGAQQISRGLMNKPTAATLAEIPRGFLTALSAMTGVTAVKSYVAGRQVLSHLLEGKGTGDVPIITDAYKEGGGRLGMTEDYQGTAMGSLIKAFQGTFFPSSGYATLGQEIGDMFRNSQNMRAFGKELPASNIAKAAFQLMGRFIETAAFPIMGHLVPTMKAGVFSMAMRDFLRVAPEAGPLETRAYANLLNKSMDNRMGEMVYDNRFWNKTAKDLAHISVRALGWNAGDIAELPGGLLDMATLKNAKIGDMNQVTPRASYVVGFVTTTALTGAAIGYMTGNPPEDLLDYIFPKTPWGRISIPGYAKDVYNMYNDPGRTVAGKVNPMFPMLHSMFTNRDWYGGVIADPKNEDVLTNIKDYAKWFGEQYMPITLKQQLQATPEQEDIPPAMRWLGVNPAPYPAREPEKTEKYQNKDYKAAVKKREKMRTKQSTE
jgi:hypothetical protein